MAAGPWTWLNKALAKPFDGTIDLDTHAFKCVLLGSAQALDATFVGASGNARYTDLTAELATANGYTLGGLALASLAISGATSSRLWTAADLSWTVTGAGLTLKYAAIFDDTLVNKDLLCFFDFNPGSGAGTIPAGPLVIVTSAGILSWHT